MEDIVSNEDSVTEKVEAAQHQRKEWPPLPSTLEQGQDPAFLVNIMTKKRMNLTDCKHAVLPL